MQNGIWIWKWVSGRQGGGKHEYHGNMGGDGSQRRILDTVAEETEEHIQSIKGQRGVYPGRSVDGVITNGDKKGDESQGTRQDEFRPRVLDENSLNEVEKLVKGLPDGSGRCDDNDTQQAEGSDTRGLLLLPDDGEPPGQVIPDPERAMDEGGEKQATARPTVDKVESFVPVAGAQEEREEGVFGGKEEDDGKLGQGDEASAVGVVEEGRMQGCTKDDGQQVADDDEDWKEDEYKGKRASGTHAGRG